MKHYEVVFREVEVSLPGSPGWVCVHGVQLDADCVVCESEAVPTPDEPQPVPVPGDDEDEESDEEEAE